nr:labial gland protein 3 [Lepeophtheirus salmonis salmonis]
MGIHIESTRFSQDINMKLIFSSLITVTLLFFSQCEAQHGIRVKKMEKLPLLFGNWKEDTKNQEGFEKLTNELKYLYPVGSNPSEMKIVYLERIGAYAIFGQANGIMEQSGKYFRWPIRRYFTNPMPKKSTRLGDMKLKGEVDGDKLHINVSDPNSRKEVLTITLWAQEVRRAKGLTLTYKNPKTGTTAQTYYTDI